MFVESKFSSNEIALLSQAIGPTVAGSQIDREENCILLRSDIHKCFDDYQFGFYQGINAVSVIQVESSLTLN